MREGANLISMKGAIEAILFVSEKPVSLEQIKETLAEELKIKPELMGNGWQSFNTEDLKQALDLLKREHDERQSAMTIVEIASGYQLLTHPRYASVLRTFYKTRQKERLSKPALETLAIIAYKQPTTRMDIELIRGVNSDGVVTHLLEKGLIKITGRREVVGRPFLYGTTEAFLEYFGLKSLDDLPKLEEFSRSQMPASGESQEDLKTAQATAAKPSPERVSETIKEEISQFLQEARALRSPMEEEAPPHPKRSQKG